MVTMAQRIEELRTKKAMSRPALAAALGLPVCPLKNLKPAVRPPRRSSSKSWPALSACPSPISAARQTIPPAWITGSAEPSLRKIPWCCPRLSARPRQLWWRSPGDSKSDGAVFSALLKSDSFKALVRGDRTGGAELPGGTGFAGQGRQKVNRKLHNAPSAKADGALLSQSARRKRFAA